MAQVSGAEKREKESDGESGCARRGAPRACETGESLGLAVDRGNERESNNRRKVVWGSCYAG
jgi:hypothetical protein